MQKETNIFYNNNGRKKLWFLLCFLLPVMYCVNAFAGKGDSQNTLDKKISVEFKNMSLKDAVAKLGQCVAGVSFTYVESGTLNEGKVNVSAKDEKASEVLNKILSPFSFNYTIVQYHVIIWYDASKAAKHNADEGVGNPKKKHGIACITGMVTSLAMHALANVTVSVSGGRRVGYSDVSGAFKLFNIDGSETLVFSAKGYKAQQVGAKAAAEGFLLVQLAKDGGAAQLHK